MPGIKEWLDKIKTDEEFAKINDGKTVEQVLKIAKQHNYNISEGDLRAVSGGLKKSAIINSFAIASGKDSVAIEGSNVTINFK